MRITVFSYSLTGNNEALAASIAAEFGAEHVKITESKQRSMRTIILDILFNRTPQVLPATYKVGDNDMVIFVGPVWMGHVASPLRAYLKHIKILPAQYAFISISGGALGPNTKLADELTKRVGKEPSVLIDLHIADLLPTDSKPTRKDTSKYRLNDTDVQHLTLTIMKILKSKVEK